MKTNQPNYLRQLRQRIDEHFDSEEFESLVFDLGMDPDHLVGVTKPRQIVSLLLRLAREGGLTKLLDMVKDERGHVPWPDVLAESVLKSDFINLAVTGEYRDLLDPETGYLTDLIYKLSGHDGPFEYVDLRGEASERGSGSGDGYSVERKLLDPAFSVIEMKPRGKTAVSPGESKKTQLESIQEAVKKYPIFALIGAPGAGKTTTLRRLALDAAWERMNNKDSPIPLWRELPRWREGQDFDSFLSEGWELRIDLPVALVRGGAALYLDGLNEMGAKSKDRAYILKHWFEGQNHPQQAIVTCRVENYRELELGITTVLIEDLDEEKIRAFAQNYLGEKVGEFLERTLPKSAWDKKDERHLFHLARNPFMLRALTMIYAALPDRDLPSNIGFVFQNLIKVLWHRERERKTPHWTSYEEMLKALSTLAFRMMEDGRATTVSLDYAEKYVSPTVLKVADSANIIRIDDELISFYHQFMQEYLTTAYVVLDSSCSVLEKLMEYITDNQWREVILMTASQLYDATEFFKLFLEKLQKIALSDAMIITLLKWVEMKASQVRIGAKRNIIVRSFYIWLALDLGRRCALDEAFDHDFDLYFPNRNRDYTRARANTRDHALDLNRALKQDHDLLSECALDLDLSLILDIDRTMARRRGRSLDPILDRALEFGLGLGPDKAQLLDRSKQVSKELNLLELHEALSDLKIPNIDDSYRQLQDFVKSFEKIVTEHRLLYVWEFSDTEAKKLSSYLQAIKLLVDCLKVANVSDRKAIENQLLLPPKRWEELESN